MRAAYRAVISMTAASYASTGFRKRANEWIKFFAVQGATGKARPFQAGLLVNVAPGWEFTSSVMNVLLHNPGFRFRGTGVQCLLNVRQQIGDILKARRESHQPFGNPVVGALLRGVGGVGHAGRVLGQ